ncbi:tyrosine protein phosphatase 1 [Entomophthora muscae]|uniref:Tyrosine protein phosphatase 1 n=1 Tax=Entomophthora muscae TaxID=34485 RepID=A0ACC2RJC9_9FUNG|nr:tyrosine protein phosphatase 1 [Entomophthora muscae]
MQSFPNAPSKEAKSWYSSLSDGKCTAADNKQLSNILATNIGELPENQGKNRYNNVLPYDSTRVLIRQRIPSSQPEADYINANYIQVPECPFKYIATQAPLPETFADFWCMITEAHSPLMLVLTKRVEGPSVKYHKYWPKLAGEPLEFEEDRIKVELVEENIHPENPDIIVAYFTVSHTTGSGQQETFPVTQLRFEGWPDFGVPSHPAILLNLIKVYRHELALAQEKLQGNYGAPVIHCSAGVGRTGTFCAVDSALFLLETWPQDSDLVVHIVQSFRQQRMMTVQSFSQFSFIYQVLHHYTTDLSQVSCEQAITD